MLRCLTVSRLLFVFLARFRYELSIRYELIESVVLYNLDIHHSAGRHSVESLFFRDAPVFSNRYKSVNVLDYVTSFDYLKARTFANMFLGCGYS